MSDVQHSPRRRGRRWPRLHGALPLLAAVAGLVPGAAVAQPAVRSQGAVAITLEDALRLATSTSESVAAARAGVTRARGQRAQVRAAALPQLNTSLAWQKQLENQFAAVTERFNRDNPNNGGGGSDSSATDNPIAVIFASPYTTTFTLTAEQALYTGGRNQAQRRAAARQLESADIGVTSAEAQARLDVTQAYFDAVLADRLLQIAESSLVQTERTLRQVQLTRQVGSASEFELIRARVTRDNQRPAFLQARTNRDLAYVRLRQLINAPAGQPLTLVDGIQEPAVTAVADAPVPTTVNVTAADVLAIDPRVGAQVREQVAAADTAAMRRAPVRQAEKGLEAARQQLRATKGGRLPSIGVSSTYQRFAYPTDGFARSLADYYPNWSVGFQVSFPLFTGGRLRGEVIAAEASVVEAEQRLQQAREGAELDARQSVAQLEEAEASWLASVGTAEQAARAYEIAEVRFREGISTQIELSESRVQLQQAQANRAQAARNLQVARVRLRLLRDLPLAGAAPAVAPGAAQGGQGATGTSTQPGNRP